MTMYNLILKTLDIKKEVKDLDYFKKADKIPLGTKEPPSSYSDKDSMTKNDFVYWEINPDEVFNILIASRAGTHKTVILKRMLKYFYESNYDCTIIDPKSYDFLLGKYVGSGRNLYPFGEYASKLPIVGCIPSFAATQTKGQLSLNPEIVNKFDEIFTLDFKTIATRDEWQTLMGVSDASSAAIIKHLAKSTSFLALLKNIRKDATIATGSKRSVDVRFSAFMADEVFNVNNINLKLKDGIEKNIIPKFLKLSTYWNKKLIPLVFFFRRDPRYQKLVVTKIIEQQWLYSETHNNNKLNIFDDAAMYLEHSEDSSSQIVANSIDFGRTYKFNNIFGMQNPERFDDNIMSSCKDKFIGDLGRPETMASFVDKNTYDLIKALRYDESNKPIIEVEYAWISANRRNVKTFFPSGSIIGHTH